MDPAHAPAAAIAANADRVRARIARAAAAAGRDPAAVRLIAVSKTFPAEQVRAAAAAGLADFGENRVQEALPKIEAVADRRLEWHLVGALQSNKARRAAAAFAWIHSVDRVDLLTRLDGAAAAAGTTPRLLLQFNLGREARKAGADAQDAPALFAAAARCTHARVCGLMVLPPWSEDPAAARPYFRQLRMLRDDLERSGVDPALLRELSMGMSRDLEAAVQEGATIVRVGTAIFGPRTQR